MRRSKPITLHTRLAAVGLACGLGLTTPPQALAEEALPPLCPVGTARAETGATDRPAELTDCIDTGAAIGELGLNWRQKLPPLVRWLPRKDAGSLCSQAQTEFGQKVSSTVPGGCVFLAPGSCTIVTANAVSPTAIGNAVRDCVP